MLWLFGCDGSACRGRGGVVCSGMFCELGDRIDDLHDWRQEWEVVTLGVRDFDC